MKKFQELFNNVTKGTPIFQYLALFTGTLNIMTSGMVMAWPSPSLPQLLQKDSYIYIDNDLGSWLVVTFLFGGICGSFLSGVLLDRLGRKIVILLTSGPFLVSWLMIAFAESVHLLFIARFVAGISDGLIFCGNCMYLAEIADPRIRGFMGCSITVAHLLGMLLINVIGSFLSIANTALVCTFVPILLLLTFSWMPETPYYLLMKGKREQARRSLQIFKGRDDVEQELNRLAQAVEEQNSSTGKILDLFTVKSNRKGIITIMGARTFQQCSGAMAFVFYLQIIIEEIGGDVSPTVGSIIYFSIQLVMSILSTLIVDRTGRRPLLIISIIGVTFCLLLEGCYFYIKNATDINTDALGLVALVGLIMFIIMYSTGMQTIPLLLVGELFPTNVKAFAVSYSDFFFSAITAIVSKFFQFTKDEFGLHVPFFAFAGCEVLGLLFIIFYVPETKGKTLEEIQEELKGTKNNAEK